MLAWQLLRSDQLCVREGPTSAPLILEIPAAGRADQHLGAVQDWALDGSLGRMSFLILIDALSDAFRKIFSKSWE